MTARFRASPAILAIALFGIFLIALQQSTAAAPTNPDPWPRRMQITGGTLTVYQPQVDAYIDRAKNPSVAPGFGVAGDDRA